LNNNESSPSPEEPHPSGEKIYIENKDTSSYLINEQAVKNVVSFILSHFGLANYELNVNFVSREEIQILNHRYRLKETPTDVLSFPQTEFFEPISGGKTAKHSEIHNLLGDLVICIDVAEKNANLIEHSIADEVAFLIAHGILHLGGHDHIHPSEEQLMLREQKEIIGLLNEKRRLEPEDFSTLVTKADGSRPLDQAIEVES